MKKALWIVAGLLAVSVVLNVWLMTRSAETVTVTERDTIWKDSIIREPVPAETIQTDRVVYIRVPVKGGDTHGDIPQCDTCATNISATVHSVSPDFATIGIPIIQKRYNDSLYTAWVSGFEPNLDSIRIYQQTITETITKTIVRPSPLITFGIQAGAGYGVFNRKPDVYIGVGGQLNFWRK